MALIILFKGINVSSTSETISSPPIIEPFIISEYRIGDQPSGANSPKNTTPEMK